MRRFWTEVTVVPEGGSWGIALDARPVRTPQRAPLAVTSAALAEAIADEWRAVGATIDPAAMPMTGLSNATIDIASPDLAAFAEPVAAYATSELFCYREDRDAVLLAEQAALWNPLLAWAEARYGVEFAITQGILPVDQPGATVTALRGAVLALDAWRLTALTPLVTIGGSLVAGLALIEGAHDADALWAAVSLDELYQERRWGPDALAITAREKKRADWDNAARFLGLL